MRLAILIAIGIGVGVVFARFRGYARPSEVTVTEASAITADARARAATWRDAIRSEPRVRQRDLAPTDKRYDPVALIREQDDINIKDVFDREPRDPAFAPLFERRAQGTLAQVFTELKLDGKIRDVHVECKTLSCYTFIEVADQDVEAVYDEINGILIGDSQMPGLAHAAKGKPAGVTLYNLYRPDARDDAYYQRFVDEALRPPLELAKQRFMKVP